MRVIVMGVSACVCKDLEELMPLQGHDVTAFAGNHNALSLVDHYGKGPRMAVGQLLDAQCSAITSHLRRRRADWAVLARGHRKNPSPASQAPPERTNVM
ncbi:hypothetical protein LMG19083_04847 [Ralstonia psammae]|uniref:Uncharacterized protein n=1 Tax=Ralstonia psammae TaxID=3058598 RepID=A0ABM9K076_9RALS|nr:hypothetical protein LMG19083_04847 [Ralstonia sp. LMG 19083]